MSKYFSWISNFDNFEIENIPQPSSEYTIELKQDRIQFEIDSEEDLDEITYSFI
jgi:hypothetical protein